MKKMKAGYLIYLFWIVGFIMVNSFVGRTEESLNGQLRSAEISYMQAEWIVAGLYVTWGLYIGLIFLNSLKFKVNWGFLSFVVLPLFIVLIYQTIKFSLFLRLDLKVLALVCGATLLYSLFEKDKPIQSSENIQR